MPIVTEEERKENHVFAALIRKALEEESEHFEPPELQLTAFWSKENNK